jgi:site-specific DNA-methyltransferase (adenine-specific)
MRLINGDSREVLKTFENNYFSSCVTDPPYGLTSITKRFGDKDSAPAKEGKDGRYQRLSKGFLGQEWDGTGIEKDPIFWAEVFRVMKPGAYLLAFGGTRTFHRITVAIEDAGFEIRDTIGWLYGQGFPKSHDLGDGWGTNLKPAFEPIIMARKPISEKTNIANKGRFGTGGINIEQSRIEIADNEIVPINKLAKWSGFGQEIRPDYEQEINTKGRWPSNLILEEEFLGDKSRFFYCAKPSKRDKGVACNHPTVKPLELMQYLVTLVTPMDGVVLDPFMGSGTTGIACKELGFDFVGIEANPEYFEIACERVE